MVSTQIDIHKKFGGVVRGSLPQAPGKYQYRRGEALEQSGLALEDMTHIAVTYGPGLVGALLVGVATAQSAGLCCQ